MGYLYSRDDVNAQALATTFSEALGAIFSREPKPYEVEVLIAEVGEPNRIYRISYDGTLNDERRVTAIGGKSEALTEALRQGWSEGLTLEAAVALGKSRFPNLRRPRSRRMGSGGPRPKERAPDLSAPHRRPTGLRVGGFFWNQRPTWLWRGSLLPREQSSGRGGK